jgi:hypothetical protein
MDFQLPISITPLPDPIAYPDKIMLVGSCFTEHIGNYLGEMKFDVLQNPHGILFDPLSVSESILSYIHQKLYTENDLVYLNEVWQSWQHHSIFSNSNKDACLLTINESQKKAHLFLQNAKWLIITLGSSFSYRLTENGRAVANCHRAPAQNFRKHLLRIEETNSALDNCLFQLFRFNPRIQVIFTVSPVRHIRDGVIENNRSKARLIEIVHHFAGKFEGIHYFPAYELVMDILRDYRFFDLDMVHPNYQATSYVLEHFSAYGIDPASRQLMLEIRKIIIARRHKAFHPETKAHQIFLQLHLAKTMELKNKYPFLNLDVEMAYFETGTG